MERINTFLKLLKINFILRIRKLEHKEVKLVSGGGSGGGINS